MRLAAIAAVLACACGDNIADRVPHDGTRLRLTWYRFADGQVLYRAKDTFNAFLIDTALGVPCRPVEWDGGELRCTPEVDQIAYTDAACTQRVARDGLRDYAAEDAWSCGNWHPQTLFRRTGPPTAQPYFLRASDGSCNADAVGMVAPVEVTEPSLQVNLELPSGDGLGVVWITSDDGLSVPTDLWDPSLGEACYLTQLNNVSTALCIPQQATSIGFADAECTVPAASGYAQCAPPTVAYVGNDLCGEDYRAVGDKLTDAAYDMLATCSATSVYTASYELGPPLTLTPLVRQSDSSDQHRIQPILIQEPGAPDSAALHDPDNFYDTVLRTECIMVAEPDGRAFCLPYRYWTVRDFFTDASCTNTRRLIWAYTAHSTCEDRAPFAYAFDAAVTTDPPDLGVRARGPIVTDLVYELRAGSCAQVTDTLYELGDVVPVSSLAAATF